MKLIFYRDTDNWSERIVSFLLALSNVHLSTLNPEGLHDPVNVMQFSELQKSWFL